MVYLQIHDLVKGRGGMFQLGTSGILGTGNQSPYCHQRDQSGYNYGRYDCLSSFWRSDLNRGAYEHTEDRNELNDKRYIERCNGPERWLCKCI